MVNREKKRVKVPEAKWSPHTFLEFRGRGDKNEHGAKCLQRPAVFTPFFLGVFRERYSKQRGTAASSQTFRDCRTSTAADPSTATSLLFFFFKWQKRN